MQVKNTTKFPDSIRSTEGRPSKKSDKNYLPTTARLVYLFIVKFKKRFPDKTPSYQYMLYKYGISNSTYGRCLKDLEKFGAIKTSSINYRGTGRLVITLTDSKFLNSRFELIPNSILDCDVYTNSHKLFLAMVWKIFNKEQSDSGMMYVSMSDNEIVKRLTPIGLSKTTVLKMLKDLSDQKRGWVTTLIKVSGGYEFDFRALSAIADRNEDRWNMLKKVSKTMFKFPHYETPEPFDFSYIETEEGSYVAEHRVERTPAIIKKLSKGGDTYEEAKERFNNENFDEYED